MECLCFWLRGKDLNQRPPGYEPDELPTALPRDMCAECLSIIAHLRCFVKSFSENFIDIFFTPLSHSAIMVTIVPKLASKPRMKLIFAELFPQIISTENSAKYGSLNSS